MKKVDPADPWRLDGREIAFIIIFWTALATLNAVNRLADPRGIGFRTGGPLLAIALIYIEWWIWALLTPAIFWLSSRFGLERRRWAVHVPLLLVIGLATAIGVDLLNELVRIEILPVPGRRLVPVFDPLRDIGRLRFVNELLVYVAILAAGYAREYFVRDQRRQREAVLLEAQTAQLQAQLADARLDALRMQINPHFLFNTLHAISALVERDPSGVRRMIARLSELLRHTVDSHGADEVTVRDELEFLRRYLDIMEVRFQGRLTIKMTIDPEAADALVPNLILQPIVENALEHGVSRSTGAGSVEIAVRRAGARLILSVCDNGPGVPEQPRPGIGLKNTRARLEQLYGDQAGVSLSAAPGGGTLAEIVVPYHTSGDLRAVAVTAEDRRDG
jgi:two-component system, LytTR family, sensor kinase